MHFLTWRDNSWFPTIGARIGFSLLYSLVHWAGWAVFSPVRYKEITNYQQSNQQPSQSDKIWGWTVASQYNDYSGLSVKTKPELHIPEFPLRFNKQFWSVLPGAGGNFDEEGTRNQQPSGRDQGCISKFFLCNLTDLWIRNDIAGAGETQNRLKFKLDKSFQQRREPSPEFYQQRGSH